jgi:hypothetical protein
MSKTKLNFHEKLTLFGGLSLIWIGIIIRTITNGATIYYAFMCLAFLLALSLGIRYVSNDINLKRLRKNG